MRFMEDLIKKEVINSSALIIGKVADVSFNSETYEIQELIVKKNSLSDSLKSSKGENVIPIEMVKHIGDKILLKGEFDI